MKNIIINRILIIAVLLFISCDEEVVSADTGQGYGSTDFFVVPPDSGVEINISIR